MWIEANLKSKLEPNIKRQWTVRKSIRVPRVIVIWRNREWQKTKIFCDVFEPKIPMHVDLHDGAMMNGHHLYHTAHHAHSGHGHAHLVEEQILPDEGHDLQCGPGASESADHLQVSPSLKNKSLWIKCCHHNLALQHYVGMSPLGSINEFFVTEF